MTVLIVWLIAFAVLLALALKAWENSLAKLTQRWLPAQLQGGPAQDRWVVSVALAVLGATFIIRPLSMILTLILLALVLWGGKHLACWVMRRVKLH